MYQNPVLFPPISNREGWLQTVQVCDDDTGDLISLVDGNGNPIYQIYLDIVHGKGRSYDDSCPYYGGAENGAIISASLADYLSIVDTGTINIRIPMSVIRTLHGNRTYDVFLRLEDASNDDGRQLLIGRLPVAYGGPGL